MPRVGGRMMRMGAAVAAVTMRKRQVQDLSMELAGQGEVTREGLEGMMQANSADGNIPVLQMQRLTQSKRVLKFLQTDAVTISVSSLEQECAVKHERTKRVDRVVSFLIFFLLFASAVVGQRNGTRSEQMTRTLLEYFLESTYYAPTSGDVWPHVGASGTNCTNHLGVATSDGCHIPPAEMKNFMDITTLEDFWEWTSIALVDRFYDENWENGQKMSETETNTWMRRIRPISGLRLVQRRAPPGVDTQDRFQGGCWAYSDGIMRQFASVCYDELGICLDATCDNINQLESKSPFGTFTNATKYYYESLKTGTSPVLSKNEEGFFVFFPPAGPGAKLKAQLLLESIKDDRWIDKASQWVRFDFIALNPDERLFWQANFKFHFETSGLVVPIATIDPIQVNYYDFSQLLDVLRALAEVGTFAAWLYNLWYQVLEVFHYRRKHPDLDLFTAWWRNLSSETHSVLLDLQLGLMPILIIMWALSTMDPYSGELNITASKVDWNGVPMFLSSLAVYIRTYFILAGVMMLLFVGRIISMARVNPRFSVLSESIHLMKGRLLNFLYILVIFQVMFTSMAVMMFGDKLAPFSQWNYAFVTATQFLIGNGGGKFGGKLRATRRGGGEGGLRNIGYKDLFAKSPTTAFIWYYPYFVVMVLVMVNIVVAIIGESYARVKARQSLQSDECTMTPSEIFHNELTPLSSQLSRGVAQRIRAFLGKPMGLMSKAAILAIINMLPETFDKECATPEELFKVAEANAIPLDDDQIKWIIERYPCIINDRDDLDSLLLERMPPPVGSKKSLELLSGTVEDLVNRQASIHAKLDLLIRMATV